MDFITFYGYGFWFIWMTLGFLIVRLASVNPLSRYTRRRWPRYHHQVHNMAAWMLSFPFLVIWISVPLILVGK